MKRLYPAIILSWADKSVKNWQNLPISNIKFGENPLTFTQVIVGQWK